LEAQQASGASRQIQRALRQIGRDWIDVMLLHYVREPLGRWAGALAALRRAKRHGDVRAIGLSTHHPRYVLAAIEEQLDAVFATLNVAGTWNEGPDGREGMVRACRQAARAGLGVVILKVLGNGALCSQKARALRWAARYPHADAVLIGMASVDELRENVTYFA
jgi:aryl-alcohol dehydrogenase-like predicted oxidoreductase